MINLKEHNFRGFACDKFEARLLLDFFNKKSIVVLGIDEVSLDEPDYVSFVGNGLDNQSSCWVSNEGFLDGVRTFIKGASKDNYLLYTTVPDFFDQKELLDDFGMIMLRHNEQSGQL